MADKLPAPHTAVPDLIETADDIAALRRDAERYRWLRERSTHIQGDSTRYQGIYLDMRIDIGLAHHRSNGK